MLAKTEFSPPAPCNPPQPVYGCHYEHCATEVSYPAEDLFWAGKRDEPATWGWYCSNCLDPSHNQVGLQSFGLSLRKWQDAPENRQ